jgi:methyltransferase family protein
MTSREMADRRIRLAPLRGLAQFLRATAADPIEVRLKIQDLFTERKEKRRSPFPYEVDEHWEQRLHQLLGVPWPCDATSVFWELWADMITSLRAKGLKIGRGAFGGWGDGEPGMTRAIWCLTRHLKPNKVVEAGVARGITSSFILEALDRNGAGHLWSIDLPPQMKENLHQEIGAAVPEHRRTRWSYIEGSSRRRLPGLLGELHEIDLFVHDSRHTERNLRFELDRTWAVLRPAGVLVADDIDVNWGFHSFVETFSGHRSLVCHAEPLEPDFERRDEKGLFGIVQKDTDGSAAGDM